MTKAETQRFLWTTPAVNRLRELAACGLTHVEIAARLGCSPNGVVGKCWRLGIHVSIKHGVSPGSIVRDRHAVLPLESRSGAGKAVLALTNQQCGWPIGDPHDEDFHYCSAARTPNISPPYCRDHLRLGAGGLHHKGALTAAKMSPKVAIVAGGTS